MEEKIKLWTIQHENAFKNFEKTGILKADNDYIWAKDEMRYAYDYMHDEMIKRIGMPKDGNVRYPIWAYYSWEGLRKKPDLRCSGYSNRGTPLVLLEFEAKKEEILLSDFDDWCLVLSYSYIPKNDQDLDKFYKKYKNIYEAFWKNDSGYNDIDLIEMKREIKNSWNSVFDVKYSDSKRDDKKSIQATLWQVRADQVKKVKHFIAK